MQVARCEVGEGILYFWLFGRVMFVLVIVLWLSFCMVLDCLAKLLTVIYKYYAPC